MVDGNTGVEILIFINVNELVSFEKYYIATLPPAASQMH